MTIYEPETITVYIHATNIKLRSNRTLSSQAFDKLLDIIIYFPHSSDVFFWKKSTSFFVRFTIWSNADLEKIINMLIVIQNINPNGVIECFTDEKIIYKTK